MDISQEYEQLKLENQLCFPMYACARKIVNAYNPYLKPLGLTYTQYIVFMVLWDKESVNVGQLGEMLKLDAGTLTPLLKRLEKDGYGYLSIADRLERNNVKNHVKRPCLLRRSEG